MADNVVRTKDLHRGRLSPTGRALLEEMEAASLLSPYEGSKPPGEQLLARMTECAPSDRAALARILGEMALEVDGAIRRRRAVAETRGGSRRGPSGPNAYPPNPLESPNSWGSPR